MKAYSKWIASRGDLPDTVDYNPSERDEIDYTGEVPTETDDEGDDLSEVG